MEIVTSIPGKIVMIVDELFNAVRKYKSNIEELRQELKRLANLRNNLQVEIEAAERKGKTIKDEVQTWIKDVEKNSAAAKKFVEDEVKENKRWLGGWCINLSSRYKLSKEAEAKTRAISDLNVVGGSLMIDVSLPAPPPIKLSFSEGFTAFKSREFVINQIMEAMMDQNVSIMGIYGMGGVGKTTLVKEIQKQAKEMKMFDEVAMAVVSQTPSITKIQDEVASWLGFKDLPEKDNETRASSLMSRFRKARRVLVILEDIWERIELSDVGVPYGKDHKGCKILLTSRSHRVCNQMQAQKIFAVGGLTKEESWSLFREVVGPEVDNPEIKPTAGEVVDECGGLPIAILILGRALKGEDQHVWKGTIQQLKKSSPTNIEGIQELMLSHVELSYNYLKSEEAKSIFLLCSCFPEDFKIPVEVLAKYGMGLMCFQNIDSMENARGRARGAVSTLIFSSLLIDGEEEGYVKMHDAVRYFVQQIASKNKLIIKAGVGLENWPSTDTSKDLTGISLMYNNINEVPDELKMNCPNLQALLLQGNYGLKIPNNFFQEGKEVTVLDLSYNNLSSLPSSLPCLHNLKTLSLSCCRYLDDLSLSLIGELSRLEILDLSGSNINKIPNSFGQLSHLRLLDLTQCRDLKIIPRGVISDLCKLEELYMSKSFRNWNSECEGDLRRNNASLIDLQALSRLTSLHIFIPEGIILPPDMLPSRSLTSFSISIGYCIDDLIVEFFKKFKKRCSRALGLSHDMRISHAWIKNFLTRSEILVLDRVSSVEHILVDLVNEGCNELKYLCICYCEGMRYVFKPLERAQRVSFHQLEWLVIESNPNFLEISHGQLPDGYFRNVKRLEVRWCGNILNMLPSHLLKIFQNLEHFEASFCESLLYVFKFEGLEIAEEETELCSSLKELKLGDLSRMTHIWKGDIQFVSLRNLRRVVLIKCKELVEVLFPATLVQSLIHLKEMVVEECSKLEEIFGSKAADQDHEMESTLALGNLASIQIWDCPKLQTLFTTSMVKSMVRLQILEVGGCSALREIIKVTDDEGGVGASTKKITFPSLFYMKLNDLYSLSCFSSGSCNIEFPALQDLIILGCRSMKTFGCRSLFTTVKSLVRLQSLEVGRCSTLKEIITVTNDEGASTKKISFPSLSRMKLNDLDSLSCFCSGLHVIEFPALEDLTIRECRNMNTFGHGQVNVVTPKLIHPQFDDEEYCWKGNLNQAIQHIFNQRASQIDKHSIKY